MLKRLRINGFKNLKNFEMRLDNAHTLIIGENGSGKSVIGQVLRIFQEIGNGFFRVDQLFEKSDFVHVFDCLHKFINIELEVLLLGKVYTYGFIVTKNLTVHEEYLLIDNVCQFRRDDIYINKGSEKSHLNEGDEDTLLFHTMTLRTDFNTWLSSMIVISPNPHLMSDNRISDKYLTLTCYNISNYLLYLDAKYSDFWGFFIEDLKKDFPNLQGIEIAAVVYLRFSDDLLINFSNLSSGEKILFLAHLIGVFNQITPVFLFWDNLGDYISLSQVQQFTIGLRRSFNDKNVLHGERGQLLVTSHNEEVIHDFPRENTLVLKTNTRQGEPIRGETTVINRLDELITYEQDLLTHLSIGDIFTNEV